MFPIIFIHDLITTSNKRIISSRFFCNSEAAASELLENHEMFPRSYIHIDYILITLIILITSSSYQPCIDMMPGSERLMKQCRTALIHVMCCLSVLLIRNNCVFDLKSKIFSDQIYTFPV